MNSNQSLTNSQPQPSENSEPKSPTPSVTDDMSDKFSSNSGISGCGNGGSNNTLTLTTNNRTTTNHFNGCHFTTAPAANSAVRTISPNELATDEDDPIEYDQNQSVLLPFSMFETFAISDKKGDSDGNSGDKKKKNQPSKAQLEVAKRNFKYYQVLDQKQVRTSCPVDKSTESIHQFASLLLSIVEGLEKAALDEYEKVAVDTINMLAESKLQLQNRLWDFSGLEQFLVDARSSSPIDPLVPMQILLSVYRLNEEASNFVRQTLPNLINHYGRSSNQEWMNFAINARKDRKNHSLVTHLNNKCRGLKRIVHNAEERVFEMHTTVRKPKDSPDIHVYPWTEHSGGTTKAKKVYIVIPKSLSADPPKSIEDVKALLKPSQAQSLPPESQQSSGIECQFVYMVQELIRNQYERNQLVELVDRQFQALNADENGLNVQHFGLSHEANEVGAANDAVLDNVELENFHLDLSNYLIGNGMEESARNGSNTDETTATATTTSGRANESGPPNESISDKTKASSTAAADSFHATFSSEISEKDQRQRDADERVDNQNPQALQENEHEEEEKDNDCDGDEYEVNDFLSRRNGQVFVEWKERTLGEYKKERFQWINENFVEGGLSDFAKKYTPLKEEVPIDSITHKMTLSELTH